MEVGNNVREITTHKANGCGETITIQALGEPEQHGGVYSTYNLIINDPIHAWFPVQTLQFQRGPAAYVGANGITCGALLAVLIDRLECFQSATYGTYLDPGNAAALYHLQQAMKHLHAQTSGRVACGVEGTHAT